MYGIPLATSQDASSCQVWHPVVGNGGTGVLNLAATPNYDVLVGIGGNEVTYTHEFSLDIDATDDHPIRGVRSLFF